MSNDRETEIVTYCASALERSSIDVESDEAGAETDAAGVDERETTESEEASTGPARGAEASSLARIMDGDDDDEDEDEAKPELESRYARDTGRHNNNTQPAQKNRIT